MGAWTWRRFTGSGTPSKSGVSTLSTVEAPLWSRGLCSGGLMAQRESDAASESDSDE